MARLPGRPRDPRDDRPAAGLDQGEDEVSRRPRRQADLRDARPHADVRQGLGVLEHDARHQVTGRAGRTWRARVGIVNPSRGDVLMYEYYRAAPPGVIVVPTALNLKRLTAEELERVLASYEAAVADLAYEECDVIVLGGSPPVTFKGHGFERELLARAQRHTSAPVVALVRCEVEALEAVGARRVPVRAPHTEGLTEQVAAYLPAAGFEVVATRCLGIERPVEMAQLPPRPSADVPRARRRDPPGADAIHLHRPRS